MDLSPRPSALAAAPFAPATFRVGPAADSMFDRDPLADLDVLQRRVDGLAGELDAARRREADLADRARRVAQELTLAGRVQRDFLPRTLPHLGRARFAALFRPAGEVSGDFYDLVRLDEHHVGLYLADAVGHGVPAALLTMYLRRALLTKEIRADGIYRLVPPAEAVAGLNAAMLDRDLTHAAHATAIYALIDVRTMTVRLARAGHPHPALLRPGHAPQTVGGDGAMLGLFPGETFDETTLTLAPGDRLVLHTDGVELLGPTADPAACPDLTRWPRALAACADASAAEIVAEAARLAHAAGPTLQDDLTVVVVEAL